MHIPVYFNYCKFLLFFSFLDGCIPLFFGHRVLLFSDDLIIFQLSGVSSFNEFIHELSVDSDTESVADSITGDDDNEEFVCPPSPLSQSSRLSHASSFSRRDRRLRRHIIYAVSWILWPLRFFISLLLILFNAIKYRIVRSSAKSAESPHLSRNSPAKRSFHIRDQFLQRTTDRRRGVFEVVFEFLFVSLFTLASYDDLNPCSNSLIHIQYSSTYLVTSFDIGSPSGN